MYSAPKSFLANPGVASGRVSTTHTAHNQFHCGYTSRPPILSQDFEQRVPGSVTRSSQPPRNEYSGISVPSNSYPKPKSYLSSTMISMPKEASYYAGAQAGMDTPYAKNRHSIDISGNFSQTAPIVHPKFLDNKSHKMNCFPKQRFTPYTGRLIAAHPPRSSQSLPIVIPMGLQQVPTAPSSFNCSSSISMNTSSYNGSNSSNGGLHMSASSFNNSKSDLDTSVVDCPELFQGTGKVEADTSASSSLVNLSAGSSTSFNANTSRSNDSGIGIGGPGSDLQKKVMLQLNNLDSSYDESALKKFLISLLKPITPIVSMIIDGASSAKIEVPSPHFAKSVISQLHRKKIGRKRMLVSYCKETINDISTLGYQVAGLLKDVPFYTLPLNKFRELFQARFKASISVLELYKMVEVCHIRTDENEEKHIHLNQGFLAKIEDSPFNPNLQHSIPYCARHFRREHHQGWAEQELEPLPHVFLNIGQVQNIVYRLMQSHTDGIPVASILHCIKACLNITISSNENGISLEHLLTCCKGIQIENNVYGIKIIGFTRDCDQRVHSGVDIYDAGDSLFYASNNYTLTPAQALAKEVIELLKICPKATMNFSKFVPAYHNYFGKQCRVADYGYTKLIELFEGMSSIIQVLGEGNNRHITLTHRIQVRRFCNDLMKTIKWQVNKSILLSKLPHLLAFTLNHTFSITDYGVCSLNDMLEELESNAVITMEHLALPAGHDVLISLPKHKQTRHEIDKTFIFSAEIVELLRNLPQYEILFPKFVKSYFYHFGYHCRMSDYGFQKLAELLESIDGLIALDPSNDENRKVNLYPAVARRIFSEQLNEIFAMYSRRKGIRVPLVDVVNLFRNKFGYSMIPQTLGCNTIDEMMRSLPFIEINESEKDFFIICHGSDEEFRKKSLMVCLLFIHLGTDSILYSEILPLFYQKFNEYLTDSYILAMKHVIEIRLSNGVQVVVLTELIKFILWLVFRLDTQSPTTIKSLNTQLNIQINTCFSLGYPNLTTLLYAFPEIFLVQGNGHENPNSEVLLQQQFFISKSDIHQYFLTLKKQKDKVISSSAGIAPPPPPIAHLNQAISTQTIPATYTVIDSARARSIDYNAPQFMTSLYPRETTATMMIPPQKTNESKFMDGKQQHQKQQSRVVPYDPSPKMVSKWVKGVKRDFIPLTIRSVLYEPPKPDTPPTKNWPFGYDPIWSEDICSPPIDLSQLKLPQVSPAKFPILHTPAHLKVPANMVFDFDAAYRDLISSGGPLSN